jgi:phage terminase large subunit
LSEKIDIEVTRLYEENLEALLNSDKRYIVNEGGARSGKSYSIMQVLITYAINNPNTSITVVSHSLPHLKKGALRDFGNIIKAMGWYREAWHNMSDNIYNLPNGSYIEFYGLEEHDKAKGPGRKILFINEANLISKALFDQLDMRTQYKVIIDLNPSDFDCWCYAVADGDDAVKLHSTYKDNKFLPAPQIRVIESYKDADEMMWQVFGLGLRGTSKEQIYTHWKLTDSIPEGQVFYGLDFGYNVASALVRITIADGVAYVKEMLYKTRLTTSDLITELQNLALKRTDEIFCDAAEPKTIEELYRAGFNVKPADKDVTEGIRKVKSYPLFIEKNSLNIIAEIKKYKWKVDKNEVVLDEPDKENDHVMDAMRYAIFTKSKTPTLTWGAI